MKSVWSVLTATGFKLHTLGQRTKTKGMIDYELGDNSGQITPGGLAGKLTYVANLADNFPHNITTHVGQTMLAPLEFEGQFCVVNPQTM